MGTMKNLNLTIDEIDKNIQEIKEREGFVLNVECGIMLSVDRHSIRYHDTYLYVLSKEEKNMLKEFSLLRIKELKEATFINTK